MRFTIPIKTVSEANSHTHWRLRQRRAKEQRGFARLCASGCLGVALPVTVKMTRLSPRELDSDNLAGALKHVRDGIADAIGIDDRDKRVTWEVDQRKAKEYGVEVEITHEAAPNRA